MRGWKMSRLMLAAIASLSSSALADDRPLSYFRDVRPIFVGNCNACHKPEKLKGELDMTSVSLLIKGGKHGAAVKPGDPSHSKLIEMVSGADPEMPDEGDPLKPAQVAILREWVKQGAVDDTPRPGQAVIEPPTYTSVPAVTSIAYSPDGSLLAVAGFHEVLLHSGDGTNIVARLTGEAPRIESIAFSRDGKYLADCGGAPSEFGLAQVWNVAGRKLVGAWQVSGDSLYGVSVSPDDKSIAFGGADKVVHRLNIADGKEMLDFKAHADWVLGTFFTLDGKQLVSASRDRAMKLIDLDSARFVDDINNPVDACISLARNPAAEQVIYGGELGVARIYKVSDNQGRTSGRIDTNLIRALEKQPGPVTAVAWSNDGQTIAVGSLGTARLYSAKDGARLHELTGMSGPVYTIAFKPDGSAVSIAGYDGMIRTFDVKTGALIKAFAPVPLSAGKAAPPATRPQATAATR